MSELILGLGNPLRGDDGVGCRVAEELARRELPPGVQALDGGAAGLRLLDLLEGWERVVIVDAAEMGRRPGEFVRFTPTDVRLVSASDRPSTGPSTMLRTSSGHRFSLHHVGLSEVLALADALGRTLPEMVIFGVQPARVGWGEGLSLAVEAALPALIAIVLEEVKGRK
ncbi:MAG: hydrogenase maturation protease [Anaerolineae bacterium]|nr:hydrogenase maturation protease [Anaerolineae bacterium]